MATRFLVIVVLGLASALLPLWAAVDAGLRSDRAYRRISQNKIVWILLALFTWIVGPLVYLIAVRPKLRAADEMDRSGV